MDVSETGPEFELRALNVARAIHDPLGLQGAVMYGGRERDGVFVDDSQVHLYEFTTVRTKEKASYDGEKLADMVHDFVRMREHSLKSVTGWFVTRHEPLPEQKAAVLAAAKKRGVVVHAIGISTLQRRLCDTEAYIQCRDSAPFGSVSYAPAPTGAGFRVDVDFADATGAPRSVREVADAALDGKRVIVAGEFGVGKSHALREVYKLLRRLHFKRDKLTPFPLHINLRDCAGLRSPAEILRRHAEEIGFKNERTLLSAWRAGACVLLLDGFDEVVPMRWLGATSDMKGVRWEAMAPLRRLIEESPPTTGIVVCGRAHYFSSQNEMCDALGLPRGISTLTLNDFTDEQAQAYLAKAESGWSLPDWVPTRPLLLGYLVSMVEAPDVGSGMERGAAWRGLLNAICQREARMYSAVRPEVIQSIVARVATLARTNGNEVGPIDMDSMTRAFVEVNGRNPDREGIQLLLRLPGLAAVEDAQETRVFVDRELANVAYGEDLGAYLANPYGEHPLRSASAWVQATTSLGVSVAADVLREFKVSPKAVLSVATGRQNAGLADAVLADSVAVARELGAEVDSSTSFGIEGVFFEDLEIDGSSELDGVITYFNCLIGRLDLSGLEPSSPRPSFRGGMIGHLDGLASMPAWLEPNIHGVEIERFSTSARTTAGIMQLNNLSQEARIAISVLEKVYGQRGSGRKEGALVRGLDLALRPLVPGVTSKLVKSGWLGKSAAGGNIILLPLRERRADAKRVLDNPSEFALG